MTNPDQTPMVKGVFLQILIQTFTSEFNEPCCDGSTITLKLPLIIRIQSNYPPTL